ncbi:serine hydrolase [Novosphingobium resinovorum]|uniref:serine hydrolase domain-containing protein n=1 Tax=Novosphingobium resinovorum TaxID=158500 RepID=UPI002ED07223|nr:serine hydrolase [Novosphingobium resinovorum]
MKRIAITALLMLAASCTSVNETRLLEERRAWWASPGHALEVSKLRPLERVPGRDAAPLPVSDALAPRLLAAAQGAIGAHRTAALLVWSQGALRLEHYGEGFGPGMLSAPASMPKPVLALAVGAAVDRGLIDIDAPVSRWIGEWAHDPRGAITLRQALQMRSGLHKVGAATRGGPGEAQMLGTRLEAQVLATPLDHAPGTRFDYNNTDNALAMLVLQRATGMRYARWLSRTVWQPLGAGDAFAWLDRPHGMARTFCCLLATPRDWVRVGRLIADHGAVGGAQVISRAWMDTMTAPSPTNSNYGLQIWRGSPHAATRSYGSGAAPPLPMGAPFRADDMLIFDGAVGQRVYVSPSRDLVIVRIGDFAADWVDSRLPNAILDVLDAH